MLALVEHLQGQGLDIRYDQVVLNIGDSLIQKISHEIADGDFLVAVVSPMMFTLWDSLAAVKAFAGDEYESAVFYPEDERFLVERDLSSSHYEVDTHVQPLTPDRPG
jgi:hypothetical protein